jgi:tetratricopeptide (TPR) repeat protein
MLFRVVVNLGLVLLASSSLIAQESRNAGTTLAGQISGQVRYVEGNRPAVNILVSCDGSTQGNCGQVMTDQSGRFRFTGLAPTQFVITVRAPGYIEERQNVELLTSPNAYLQFQLKADGSSKSAGSGSPVIDSNVPEPAKKEFLQAEEALANGKKEGLDEGVRHLEKAISIYPKFLQAQLKLGAVYMDMGQWDKAEQALIRALEIDPKTANAMFALGEVYLRQKKDEAAEKILVQALALEDRSFQGHLILGRVYWDMAAKIKDVEQARPLLEKSFDQTKRALELNPNLAGAHLLKGNLFFRVRRATDALHEYEEYLRLEPKGEFAEQTRALVDKIKKALAQQRP